MDLELQATHRTKTAIGSMTAPVAIVGMHRSGTSMIANVLQEAGLHLGAEADLMPPADENPAGFFEHLGFVRLNDEVLSDAGAGWDCPPPPATDWGSGTFEALRTRAQQLAEPLQAAGAWGWKDPRTSLTLPFWRSALGPLRTVVVVRNPLEVVTSLHRRNGFSVALSLTLWQIYAERILADSAQDARLVTHYDAFFTDPEREINRLLDFLELQGNRPAADIRAAAIPALRHHRKSTRDLADYGFPATVLSLYGRFCREAEWQEGAELAGGDLHQDSTRVPASFLARGLGRVDLVRVENEALRRNNEDFVAALAGRESRITELESALKSHEAQRTELEGRVAERDSRLIERDALIARRDHAVAVLQQQLAQNSAERSRLREQVAALGERLAERERSLDVAEIHERELRSMLNGLQAIQHGRDAEIMGTLGSVLSRYAPGAPASIYYRRLVHQVRQLVDATIPSGARVLVANYGDGAMLSLGDRLTESFPPAALRAMADYTDVDARDAIAHLEVARDDGARFLVVPSPALPWLASYPELERHLEAQATIVARERGIAAIYDLNQLRDAIPA